MGRQSESRLLPPKKKKDNVTENKVKRVDSEEVIRERAALKTLRSDGGFFAEKSEMLNVFVM